MGIPPPLPVSQNGTTPLVLAASLGNLAMVEVMLEKGADKDLANKHGETALLLASKVGHLDVVRFLLAQKGISVDKHNEDGDTALLVATRAHQVGVTRLLLDRGADRTLVNRAHESAQALARTAGHPCRALFWGSGPSEAGSSSSGATGSSEGAGKEHPASFLPPTEGQVVEALLAGIALRLQHEYAELKDDSSASAADRAHYQCNYEDIEALGAAVGARLADMYSPSQAAALDAATDGGAAAELVERLRGSGDTLPPPNGYPEDRSYPDGRMHCRYAHVAELLWPPDCAGEPSQEEQAEALALHILTAASQLHNTAPPHRRRVSLMGDRLFALTLRPAQNGADRGYSPVFILSDERQRNFRGYALLSWLSGVSQIRSEDVAWLRHQAHFTTNGYPLSASNPRLHKEAADAAMAKGNFERARSHYARSIELLPSASAYSNLAACLLRLEEPSGALELCMRALREESRRVEELAAWNASGGEPGGPPPLLAASLITPRLYLRMAAAHTQCGGETQWAAAVVSAELGARVCARGLEGDGLRADLRAARAEALKALKAGASTRPLAFAFLAGAYLDLGTVFGAARARSICKAGIIRCGSGKLLRTVKAELEAKLKRACKELAAAAARGELIPRDEDEEGPESD